MRAAAYRYADSGQYSPEMQLAGLIDRFGVAAVMGRPVLYAREIQRISIAEQVVRAYRSRQQSNDWAAWRRDNGELAKALDIAEKVIRDAG